MYNSYVGVAYRGSTRYPAAENIAVVPDGEGYAGDLHHVVLGTGVVRLACYKVYPELWVDGTTVDCLLNGPGSFEGYSWEVEGDDDAVKVRFTEPDGTVWEATVEVVGG